MNPTPEQVAQWRQATGDLIVHSRTGASWSFTDESLQHFATLACAWQAEQDAAICDNKHMTPSGPADCAAAIRANAPKVTT